MKISLPISYNRLTPMSSAHDDPLTFMQMERFFDDFTMIVPFKIKHMDLSGYDYSGKMEILRTPIEDLLQNLRLKSFAEIIKKEPKRKTLLYSPLNPPYRVNPLNFIMNSPTIAHAYENKRYFRDEFSGLIRMPEYVIKYIDELDKAASYKELQAEFGIFVLQDEESHGSRGTFIVRSLDQYVDAVRTLKRDSSGRSIVVSRFVKGNACSIQVCVTKYGIFSSGVQKQLINSRDLCNPELDGTAKWCGGEVGADFSDIVKHQAQEMATIVGSELSRHGYKGIFGVDLIVTPSNEVYAIEINARLTGYSHIISDMQYKEGKIPYMLLHTLELANIDYEVTDMDALPSIGTYKKPVSYMIICNPLAEDFVVEEEIQMGVYKMLDDRIEYLRPGYSICDLKKEDELLISGRGQKGLSIGSGWRILKITKLGKCMKNEGLGPRSKKLVETVKKHFSLPL